MDPFTLMSLVQGGVGIAQTIGSLFKKDERPTYEMPNALKQSLALANAQVGARMPGYTQATDQANMVAANQLSAASQSGNALEAVQTIAGSQQGAMRDIAQLDAQSERQDIANLQQTLAQVAQAQDQEFMANEMAPYQDSSQEKRDLMGAGMENVFGAMNLFAVGGNPLKKKPGQTGNSPADVMRAMPGMFNTLYGL